MGDDAGVNDRLRELPSVDRVIHALSAVGSPLLRTNAARRAVDDARSAVRRGRPVPTFDDILSYARAYMELHGRSLLHRVINATGVVIHTNLGRVPLGDKQLEAVRTVAGGYSNLEYDLERGTRGSRYTHARTLIESLTGAESSLVVNNNAAAVLLVLTALCAGREVIISRGELIEIGGEFRIPDVMNASGAMLREIGTTNRTHVADYERAITAATAAIMKVHPSNYRMIGFTAEVSARELARLARGRGVLFINDLGSGLVVDQEHAALRSEPLIGESIVDGADVITFSGDKLLGGPQAGIIAGRAELISRLEKHPLLRALRVDKMTLAALEATLDSYLNNKSTELPVWRMLSADNEELKARATKLARALGKVNETKVEAVPLRSITGGGSAPGTDLPSWGVAFSHPERRPEELDAALRFGDPPVVARIENDVILVDMRTVFPGDDERLVHAIIEALTEGGT